MVEHFGGLEAYLAVDFWTAKRHELVWRARNIARSTQEKRQNDDIEQQRREHEV